MRNSDLGYLIFKKKTKKGNSWSSATASERALVRAMLQLVTDLFSYFLNCLLHDQAVKINITIAGRIFDI